ELGEGQGALADRLIRLHVIASSNDLADQYMKFEVRDFVLEEGREYFAGLDSREEARQVIEAKRSILESRINAFLDDFAAGYRAEVVTGIFPFPEKVYGNLVAPAGDYYAVRIILGEGQGRNWWCVLFPPLCFAGTVGITGVGAGRDAAAGQNNLKYFQPGMEEVQVKYESRLFAIWDWFRGLALGQQTGKPRKTGRLPNG
ncbi:MAG: stage II sporulation protein R, partial [Halanaerobium sp.]|nr:stage II sporulation protein R [Halanaerobium sp.]